MTASKTVHYTVYGVLYDPLFQQCAEASCFVNSLQPKVCEVTVTREMPRFYHERQLELVKRGLLQDCNAAVVVCRQRDQQVGNYADNTECCETGEVFLKRICAETSFQLIDGTGVEAAAEGAEADSNRVVGGAHPSPLSYASLAKRAYVDFWRSTGHSFCWMDIHVAGERVGRITYELYSDLLPRTCGNFRHLCSGDRTMSGTEGTPLTYKASTFFRVVRNAWIMGGDISAGHRGNSGYSVYGRVFPDESFAVPHDTAGVLGMCNDGPNTNASSFYITLRAMAWMDRKYVAFGRVIDGMNVVEAIQNIPANHNQSFTQDVFIGDCGVVDLE